MPDIIKEVLKKMNKIIDQPQYNNAMVVAQTIMELMKNNEMTLSQAEQTLREMKSRVYLLGLPLHVFNSGKTALALKKDIKPENCPPPTHKYISKLPDNDEFFQHALWVCMNGKKDVQDTIKNFKLKENDLDLTLERTGFLYINEGNN